MIKRLIERPVAVTMTLIAVLVLGFVSIGMLPVSLMPDIQIPQITVRVVDDNASARELDATIVKPLKNQLMQVSHLRDITTEARNGTGTIFMQFDPGSDINYLFIETNEKIDRAMSSLPRDMERPKVVKASATDIPAFFINMSLTDEDDDGVVASSRELFPVSPKFMELSRFAGQVIAKRIEQIPQVAMVDVSGLSYPELLIVPDRKKLESLGISEQTLENALQRNNIKLGNLTIREGEYQYDIRFESDILSKKDIENVYLNIHDRLYQFKDLATVIEHPQRRQGMVRSDSHNAVSMAVIKQSDAQMSDLRAEINGLMQHFRNEYPHVQFTVTRDQTQLLEYSIGNLRNDIIVGALLACLIIFLFMQDFRTPVLVTITIPLALIVSLLFFHLLGITINIVSLSGLVLGIGMMVDNSIVVIDNISQHWDRGEPLKEAVPAATNEVFGPMLSSVLTTCSVFVPLIFLSGIAGSLFYDQAMAVAIGLFSSLMVSVLVIPVYYYLFYRKSPFRPTNRYLEKLAVVDFRGGYERILKWFFRHQRFVWISFIAVFPALWFVYTEIDKEKLPPLTQDDILMSIDWNSRISPEDNDRRTDALMSEVADLAAQRTAMTGIQQFILSHTRELSASEALVYVRAKSPDHLPQIKERLEKRLKEQYPDAMFHFEMSGNIFDMIFSETEPPLVARLKPTNGRAPDPDKLNALLGELSRALPDIYIEPAVWQEHVLFVVKPRVMALYGIDYNTVFSALKKATNQNRLFTINEGTFSIPVVSGNQSQLSADILETKVTNGAGVDIPLSMLVGETRSRDLKNIISGTEGDFYPVNIEASDRQIPQLMSTIRTVVQQNDDFDVGFSGSYFSNRTMIGELIVVLTVAFLLLFFILAAQFESLVQPLIILSEILVDIFGALLILWLLGASINLMSLIGLVVMCGVVINDSILKVDTINKLRKQGYSLIRAIMEGGSRRIKPIVMTSLSTILAVLPFLYRGDMGSDLQYPLSLTLISGMIVGTVVSVFYVPVFYYTIYKSKKKR